MTMRYYSRQAVIRALWAIAIAGLLSSCTDSKSSQCDRLATAVNKIRPIAEQFQQDYKTFDTVTKTAKAKSDLKAYNLAAAALSTSFTGLTGQLDGVIQDIQGVQLTDLTLVGLRDSYVKTAKAYSAAYKENSNTLLTISKIDNTPRGLQDLRQSQQNFAKTANMMSTLRRQEASLVGNFKSYCGAK